MVDPRLLLYTHECFIWGVEYHYHCHNIVIDSSLDIKIYFVVKPMDIFEAVVVNCFDLFWWPYFIAHEISTNITPIFPNPIDIRRKAKNIHPHHTFIFITIGTGSISTCPIFYARSHLRAPKNGHANISSKI